MSSNYSPGPWGQGAALSSDPHNIRYISDDEGNQVAAVRSGFTHFGPDQFGQDTALANAKLITAAPQMFEALNRIIHTLEDHPQAHTGNAKVHFVLMTALNAAIKAGRQQP